MCFLFECVLAQLLTHPCSRQISSTWDRDHSRYDPDGRRRADNDSALGLPHQPFVLNIVTNEFSGIGLVLYEASQSSSYMRLHTRSDDGRAIVYVRG